MGPERRRSCRADEKGFEMRGHGKQGGWKRWAALAAVGLLLHAGSLPADLTAAATPAPTKMKIRGYLTGRVDSQTVAILDDQIQMGNAKIVSHDSTGEKPMPCWVRSCRRQPYS